jgi:hypothetical protein
MKQDAFTIADTLRLKFPVCYVSALSDAGAHHQRNANILMQRTNALSSSFSSDTDLNGRATDGSTIASSTQPSQAGDYLNSNEERFFASSSI